MKLFQDLNDLDLNDKNNENFVLNKYSNDRDSFYAYFCIIALHNCL